MKQTILFYSLLLYTVISFAQVPEKMSYQAIIRDAGNAVVASTTVGMQISILKGSAGGTAVYVETQTPTTNINGLASIEIGDGSVVSGVFSDIDWSNDDYFIKTETDPTNTSSYTITGTSQLLSVPYALYAKNTKLPISKVFTDNLSRNVSGTWTAGPSFDNIDGFKANSFVKITYHIPARNDATSGMWGGLYIEPQISFDDGSSWSSLGSSGFDGGVMMNNTSAIGSYFNKLLIDPGQSVNFSVKIRFYYSSYNGTAVINDQHGINIISGTAALMTGDNGLQHFTKVIVEEVFQ